MNRFKALGNVLVVLFLFIGLSVSGNPFDKIVEFYTSSIPRPPKVALDIEQVIDLAETGDIIIENNRGFPQWYAAIAAMVPGTRYIHAGMVIKGHVLLAHLAQLEIAGTVVPRHAYVRCLQTATDKRGKPAKIWQWVRAPILSNGKYVVTPEVTRGAKMSRVVALHLRHYLQDPAVGYPCKHIQLLRAPIASQKALTRLSLYLAYHVMKETGYDMGFSATEEEPAISRTIEGELTFDFSLAPVPLYCTELIWRALREAEVQVMPTHLAGSFGDALRKIAHLPASLAEKIRAPFVTADLFIRNNTCLYANAAPPHVPMVIGAMIDDSFKNACRKLSEKFQNLFRRPPPR